MAWSTPQTRATGAIISADIWSQEVVDNTLYLSNRPAALFNATTTSIPDVTSTQVELSTVLTFDTDNMDESVANHVAKIQTAGVYACFGQLNIASTTSANDGIGWLQHSGGEVIASRSWQQAASVNEFMPVSFTGMRRMAAGDTISLWCYHNTGASRNVSATRTGFGLYWLSDGGTTP